MFENGIADLKDFLDSKYSEFNVAAFIETDPVQVPHMFSEPENIYISAFLTSVISWGRRSLFIPRAMEMMRMMDNRPYDFILNAGEDEIESMGSFYYRTFQAVDMIAFVRALRKLYREHGGLKELFEKQFELTGDIRQTISAFYRIFTGYDFPRRSLKHIANVDRGSAAKRLNMFLRWMVRDDGRGVDFGLWKAIPSSALMIPLDLHSGNVARKLGLLGRKQNDWKAVEELTAELRKLDPEDPVKYDFALFGLGVFEKF